METILTVRTEEVSYYLYNIYLAPPSWDVRPLGSRYMYSIWVAIDTGNNGLKTANFSYVIFNILFKYCREWPQIRDSSCPRPSRRPSA